MYRIGQVAAQLDVSPSTLRRLSDRFAAWLSEEGGRPPMQESGRRAARSYSEEDVALLERIQALKSEGQSDEEIEAQLEEEASTGTEAAEEPAIIEVTTDGRGEAIVILESGDQLALSPQAAAALGQAMRQVSDMQHALVAAQQAHRDLINVVINDALSLKDENERLRRRLRMMEEEMNRLKESEWNHRLSTEERISQLERVSERRRSFWDRLRGK